MLDPVAADSVRKRLLETPNLPTILWPNDSRAVEPPFLSFQDGPQSVSPLTIDGIEVYTFRPVISFVWALGQFTSDMMSKVTLVSDRFSFGQQIDPQGGPRIEIVSSPTLTSGESNRDIGVFRRDLTLNLRVTQE